eukprot:6320113-Pyramimonas_sp.AAC.1
MRSEHPCHSAALNCAVVARWRAGRNVFISHVRLRLYAYDTLSVSKHPGAIKLVPSTPTKQPPPPCHVPSEPSGRPLALSLVYARCMRGPNSVSYTHLTLPTILLV